jgi:FOG: Transposase and inactivated derivatives
MIDSTLISLCAKVFPWAHYGQTKGAIKLHTLLDYEGCLPKYVHITDGKVADVTAVKEIPIPNQAVVVADRGYESYDLFKKWDEEKITFVVRIKQTTGIIRYKEYPLPEEKHPEILLDEEVLLEDPQRREKYPKKLRRVVIYLSPNDVTIELITNNFTWTAETISNLYKSRWQIESFSKDLKSRFKIKTFVWTSSNAVEIQIWTALITILVLKYLRAISKYNWSLSNLIAFLRMHLFTKMELEYWLDTPFKQPGEEIQKSQYRIFENIKNDLGGLI